MLGNSHNMVRNNLAFVAKVFGFFVNCLQLLIQCYSPWALSRAPLQTVLFTHFHIFKGCYQELSHQMMAHLDILVIAVISLLTIEVRQYFFLQGDVLYCIQHCFICRPSDSIESEDAGIEPRTVATSALAFRRSNH